ncbi:MAG: tRNA guanosine(34) transglycosylase Tgt [Phycisphaerales bacterium]|nr:tRNA guanosine(34) transglycosylase Tgt [Phycisphaerales bacterium]
MVGVSPEAPEPSRVDASPGSEAHAPVAAAGVFRFELQAADGRARAGVLHTPHGAVETPAFMPVGTRATVKSLTPAQLREAGVQIVLANTYHLMLRPGAEVVAQLGGLHAMMAWEGAVLTDSGGYQVYSLADLRQIDDDGVTFRSHIDGSLHRLTPESAVQIQNQLGADIIMVLDECPPLPAEPPALEAAVRRTVAWAARCKAAHTRSEQALYGIVQGGLDVALRRACLAELVEVGFDGYALGGLSVGEPPPQMYELLDGFVGEMPASRPRYLMGVGTPADLVHAVGAGIDQFDCVLPTRNGRKGYAFTRHGTLRLRNAAHRVSREPIDSDCACYTCRHFTRGYLRHLFLCGELLGGALVSLHNVAFYQALMREMRAAITAQAWAAWQRAFLERPAEGPNNEKDSE